MPSGGQTPIDPDIARDVVKHIRNAIEYGLLLEWVEFFLGGLQAGEDPCRAAMNASIEWDL